MIFVAVSTGHFDPLIRQCDLLRNKYDFLGQIGSGLYIPQFNHFKTCSPDILMSHMREAEIVISHGGTGMLSMLYALKKRTIVIPKQIRYGEANDSQVELAVKWGQLGMGILCLDVEEIDRAIEACRKMEFTFPSFNSLGNSLRGKLFRTPPVSVAESSLS